MIRMLRPAIAVLFILTIQSCGKKPVSVVPSDVTIEQILASFEKQASGIHDFSGRARATAKINGRTESAAVYINYRSPDRFRVIIKGTFGIVLSVIVARPDSYTVYIPSLTGYFVAGRGEDISALLVPGMRFDIDRITSMFTGAYPPADIQAGSRVSLKHKNYQAILALEDSLREYRYTVEGPGLLLVKEEILKGSKVVWRRLCSDFISCGDVMFPRRTEFTEGKKMLALDFSTCSVNTGLAESDLVFDIPANAERLILEEKNKPAPNRP
ncbi:DUF4292 domain-containing protein [bacterium]|nr:DUF4292 domain-containing protein [bacterium]